jgi:hypothetical protein
MARLTLSGPCPRPNLLPAGGFTPPQRAARERVTGVKGHSVTVQRCPSALTSTDYSPRAAVRTGWTGYTFDAGGLRPVPVRHQRW